MTEYFIVSESFAAPFFSDRGTSFIEAETPKAALKRFAAEYGHPCGLYSAAAFESANAYHKHAAPLAQWLCNHEIEKRRITKDLGSYSYLGEEPGRFKINGEMHEVANSKEGRVLETEQSK